MGLSGAWLAALGITGWREVRQSGHMPVPGALAGVTLLFLGLGLLADAAPPSRPVVTALGWGLDVAGLLNILPGGLFGQVEKAQETEARASGEATRAPVEVL